MISKETFRQRFTRGMPVRRSLVIALCAVLIFTGFTVFGDSSKSVNIFDGEKNYLIRTFDGNIPAALRAAKLSSDNYRIVSSKTDKNTISVEIEYLISVFITSGNVTNAFDAVLGSTVGDILAVAGFTVDAHDMIEPAAETVISDTMYIDYTNIDYVSGSYTEAIPYSTVTVNDASLTVGTETVTQGTEGVQQVYYTDKYVNGEKTESTVSDVVVLSNAVNATRTVGTKPVSAQAVKTSSDVACASTLTPSAPIELDANGVPVNYTKKLTARATAYTYTGNRCSTGVSPQPGYIAVNPNYIPYGTRMYIRTADGSYIYGYAVAADTGGFIKKHPTGVDLFLSSVSACYAFGVRNVEIYILP